MCYEIDRLCCLAARRLGQYRTDDPEEEQKQRTFQAHLNKLTPDNFTRIITQIEAIEVSTPKTLKGFVEQIFSKALVETIFCELYSKLCRQLHESLPQCVSPIEEAGNLPHHRNSHRAYQHLDKPDPYKPDFYEPDNFQASKSALEHKKMSTVSFLRICRLPYPTMSGSSRCTCEL